MIRHFDIVVVGAGPAGSMAAKAAAEAGRKVCLVERKPVAGFPVRCGEGIGLKGAASNNFSVDPSWIKRRINRIRLVAPDGTIVEVNRGAESYVLDRRKMDFDLMQQACACGAEYYCNTTIRSISTVDETTYACLSDSDEFRGHVVILAEGVESRLARTFQWNTVLKPENVECCAFCRITHESIVDDACTFYTGSAITPAGYGWVFPRGNHEANVGLGVLGSHSKAGEARQLLEGFVRKNFPEAKIEELHCGGVPAGAWTRPLVKNGIMLVGDAAGQVISLTGAGINYAIYAGNLAGKTAALAFSRGKVDFNTLKKYERQWAGGLGKQQLRSYALKRILIKKHGDTFLNGIARSLSRNKNKNMTVLTVFLRTFAAHPVACIKALFLFR